jgi:hypothetical protein
MRAKLFLALIIGALLLVVLSGVILYKSWKQEAPGIEGDFFEIENIL